MKIGFFAIGLADLARPDILAAAATTAERVGFSTLWTGEHIVFVEKIESAYPYARETTAPPVPTDLPILNPFVALSYAAAMTKRIRLATGVCLVPDETAEKVKRLEEFLREKGRSRDGFEIFVSPVVTLPPHSVPAYRDAGDDELYLAPVFATPFPTVAETTKVIEDLGRKWVQ